MCRPSLQDSQQLEKPHLLPWSTAIGPQPDPNKHHLFYTTEEKEIEGESGARGMQRRSEGFGKKRKRKKGGCLHGGLGSTSWGRKPQEDYEHWALCFSSTSLFWKPLYRLADPFRALSLSQSFLPLSAMQNPSPARSQIITLIGWLWQFMNYSTRRCSHPDSFPHVRLAAGEHFLYSMYFYCIWFA